MYHLVRQVARKERWIRGGGVSHMADCISVPLVRVAPEDVEEIYIRCSEWERLYSVLGY